MMLLAIAGNCFAYSKHIMLTDLFIGKELLKKFQGPKFGVDGIRKLTGVQERPLSLHIIKPKMGMTPEQTANQVGLTAQGGADMCKDDEMLADAYNNTDGAATAVGDARKSIGRPRKTGKRMIYMCSITDEPRKMMDKARRAIDLGANGLLVTYSAGLGAFRELTSHPDINVPVMLHASHMIAMMKQVAWPVLAKLCRLCGADMMLTPTMWSSIPMVSMEEGLRTSFVKLAAWGHIKRTFPMPVRRRVSGPGRGDYRRVRAGHHYSGRRRHVGPSGRLHGRRQSWQQAIAAAMAGVPLPEAAQTRKLRPAASAGEMGLHGAAQDALVAAGARLSAEGHEVSTTRPTSCRVVASNHAPAGPERERLVASNHPAEVKHNLPASGWGGTSLSLRRRAWFFHAPPRPSPGAQGRATQTGSYFEPNSKPPLPCCTAESWTSVTSCCPTRKSTISA